LFSWGLIGAGDIVRKRVAAALHACAGCELAAVSRARAELAEAFAREVGARRWHADWRGLVADPGVDGVYVATPVHLHAEQTIAAAEAGKHVLCEKPMAMDLAECDRMIAACRAAGVTLGVAYYRRFYPVVARAKQMIDSGEIGTPVFAQITAFEPFAPRPGDPRSWLVELSQSGGGPMADFGCHRIEVLTHLLGPVRRVTSIVSTVLLLKRDVEDTAVALLQFERGATGLVAVTHAAAERQDTLDLFGSRGSIRITALNSGNMIVRIDGRADRAESHPPASNTHLPLVEDFIDSVRAGRAPAVDGEAGRSVAAIQDAVYADLRTGR
jgi:predicted dehydrogenase